MNQVRYFLKGRWDANDEQAFGNYTDKLCFSCFTTMVLRLVSAVNPI